MVDSGNRAVPAPKNTFDYDAELRHHHRRLREAIDLGPGDSVLDIGCGTGQLTREVAKVAHEGSTLGVDISPGMLTRARELSAAEDVRNVRFEQADAQVHPFPAEHFTRAVSRFGTMFFADPVAAFTNIGRALRPEAQLVQLVWQAGDRQEWVGTIRQALVGAPVAAPTGGAFSLADPADAKSVLTAAGFADVTVAEVHEPVYYGPDPAAGVDSVLALRMATELLAEFDADETERALDRLDAVMTAHCGTEGVWFDSRAWLITARR
ncbi:methyltransferase domain-containing protein [Nocardia sp. NPDC046473]|uniref:class I SAM-dependent methyltransferase n=1 Tax=Nocardia sp. NPDC046473 TaxID=3155733 RepID=UPI0033DD6A13